MVRTTELAPGDFGWKQALRADAFVGFGFQGSRGLGLGFRV